MPDFGAELKRRRMSAGMSLTGLAASVHFTKGYLSKVENGKVRANRDLAGACDRALGAGGELLALVSESAFPARRSAGGIAGLPDTGRYFVGRETELEALSALLLGPADARVGVVHGMRTPSRTAASSSTSGATRPGPSSFRPARPCTGCCGCWTSRPSSSPPTKTAWPTWSATSCAAGG
jgi:transcriptional regulator with XRE-family HTH domain